jgi:hypothetical protein
MKVKVMVKIEGSQTIEGMSREDVFDAGSLAENLPKNLKLITLSPKDEILQNGTEIGVDLTIPKLPKLPRLPGLPKQVADLIAGGQHSISAEVKKCEPGRLMLIEGESDIASTALLLKLRELRNGEGTEVTHKLEVNIKDLNLFLKRAVETILRVPMDLEVKLFSKQHIDNIIAYYEALAVPMETKSAKKTKPDIQPGSEAAVAA